MNILFVCTANVSRSFLAEKLLKNEIERLKLDNISILSVGLFAYPGNPPDPKMVDYLSEKGIPVERHEATQITMAIGSLVKRLISDQNRDLNAQN